MLKKRLGSEAIERDWPYSDDLKDYFKVFSFTRIIIPEGCERIGDSAFWGCTSLREVIIPKSVKKIGDYVFRNCKNLRKVIIPKSVEEIGNSTFRGCDNAVVILKKPRREFKEIGKSAFWGCRYVKEEIRN